MDASNDLDRETLILTLDGSIYRDPELAIRINWASALGGSGIGISAEELALAFDGVQDAFSTLRQNETALRASDAKRAVRFHKDCRTLLDSLKAWGYLHHTTQTQIAAGHLVETTPNPVDKKADKLYANHLVPARTGQMEICDYLLDTGSLRSQLLTQARHLAESWPDSDGLSALVGAVSAFNHLADHALAHTKLTRSTAWRDRHCTVADGLIPPAAALHYGIRSAQKYGGYDPMQAEWTETLIKAAGYDASQPSFDHPLDRGQKAWIEHLAGSLERAIRHAAGQGVGQRDAVLAEAQRLIHFVNDHVVQEANRQQEIETSVAQVRLAIPTERTEAAASWSTRTSALSAEQADHYAWQQTRKHVRIGRAFIKDLQEWTQQISPMFLPEDYAELTDLLDMQDALFVEARRKLTHRAGRTAVPRAHGLRG